jgi:hypothetical protein
MRVQMENWKRIEGFANYEVSDLGRVRSVSHPSHIINRWGQRMPMFVTGRVLKPGTINRGKGYLFVSLSKDGKYFYRLVHRLVAKAFIPNPNNLPEVNHLGKTVDCRAVKLEWRSRGGNMQDAVKTAKFGKYAGVYFETRRKHWVARYWHNKHVYVGSFPTKREALEARRAAVAALPEVL